MSALIKQTLRRFYDNARNELANKKEFSGASIAVVAILLLLIMTLSNQLFRGARLDLTENQLYTLSPGTDTLLSQIDEPINLTFFYSGELARGIPQISTYAQRVRDMLQEMATKAEGDIKLTIIDPEPFSDEEDRAVQLGIQAVPLGTGGDKLYFGLAGSNSVGDTETIGFFQLDREELLEYDLAKLIYQLNLVNKPVVGVLSTLDVQGGFDTQRMQPKPAWVIIEQLRQFFEVRTLQKGVAEIPADVELLVLIHPAELPGETLYAIDQFVLSGRNALVFLDSYAEAANPQNVSGPPGEIVPRQSNPKQLLEAWGVELVDQQVLLDAAYALQVRTDPTRPPFFHYALFGIPTAGLDQQDVVTRGLNSINVAFPGFLKPLPDAKTTFTALFQSSDQAMPIPSYQVQPGMDAATLQNGFEATGEDYVLAARLNGKISSAFPDGPPADNAADESADKPDASTEQLESSDHLSESEGPVNIMIVADVDMLDDPLWIRIQNFLGQRISTPLADNGNFFVNAVDNLLGSDALISIRSRAGYSRPFERVDDLQREADSRFRVKEEELQARLRETENKLNQLQNRKDDNTALILSPEQRQELLNFQQEQIKVRKELRDVQHQLNKEIDQLGTLLKFINILLVPLLLVGGVIAFNVLRRKRSGDIQLTGGQS
ncbi:MAG: Gldg family protein [Candidatus Competibacteraceae bacterium]|jgi:ABC-type uncharacterized transport system involved in gliding motility auxiliary subunit|nr:Gldg family protein [Candidatus Competibacteraceae bacterium]